MEERILVVGNNVRNVVQSAFKAGYDVYALTKFLDSDLLLFCERTFRIEDESSEWVRRKADELAESLNASVVLASGYEDLEINGEILGCEPKAISNVVDKLRFYRRLDAAGLPYPEVLKKPEGKCILKPIRGGGGEEIRVVDTGFGENTSKGFESRCESKEFIIQRLVEGFPCSTSLIIGREPSVIALNEILAGWREMNARGFRYCGNVTPLVCDRELRGKLTSLAKEVCDLFELKGSVGVDFVVEKATMRPYILEINPRFQGSLDSIEWSTGLNVFSLHVKALRGEDEVASVKYRNFAARCICFAERKVEIKRDLTGNPFFADVPVKGTVYERDDPLVSILASGGGREDVLEKAVGRKETFLKLQNAG